jgi:HD-GYP domain-containing protein (c-di-GMP phosphodiesterase class II)
MSDHSVHSIDTSIHSIDTTDLQIGSSLPFDLRDPDGNIVHKSGLQVTQRLLDRLSSLGITSVTVKSESQDAINPLVTLASSFDPEIFTSVSNLLEHTTEKLRSIFRDLQNSVPVSACDIDESVSAFVKQIAGDASAVLGVLAVKGKQIGQELSRYLAERSVRMSYFAVANAIRLGYSEREATRVGTLAMLADVSLLNHPEWFGDNHRMLSSVFSFEEYKNHSIESANIVKQNMDFGDSFIESMSQIHELADGSGYPYGLTEDQQSEESKIVNLVDTYLSMTEEGITGKIYLESDVLAFLMHQATSGKFDKRVVRGFIKTFSLYPVGVLVRLDDNSLAVVTRTNPNNPFQPVVKCCDSTGRVKDLSVSANYIVGPATDISTVRERIGKSQMGDLLWLPDRVCA